MSLQCPDDTTDHNLVEINDLLNGFQGDNLNTFAHEYSRFRDSLLRSQRLLRGDQHITYLIKNHIQKYPCTNKKREKKKTRIQFVYEENHYPTYKPSYSLNDPVILREARQEWKKNPNTLYLPTYIGDRLKAMELTKERQ